MRRGLLVGALLVALFAMSLAHVTSSSQNEPIFLLNAAMKKAWMKIIPLFEKKYHVRVEVIYGSSGHLLAQLEITGKGDVYSPATPIFMKKAIEKGLVDPRTVSEVACLRLAILVPSNSPIKSLEDLLKGNYKIALCDLESCAVGKFAKKVLEMNGLWEALKGKVVTYTENFAKLVSLVELGQVDAAIGWSVAHYWYPKGIRAIPLHLKVPYEPCIEIAMTRNAVHEKLALQFIEFLKTPQVVKILKDLGYEVRGK